MCKYTFYNWTKNSLRNKLKTAATDYNNDNDNDNDNTIQSLLVTRSKEVLSKIFTLY